MAHLQTDSEIIKLSEDDSQVTYTYKKTTPKKIFSSKTKAIKKTDQGTDKQVTLVLFSESLIDKIQEALSVILKEKSMNEIEEKPSVMKRISDFLMR